MAHGISEQDVFEAADKLLARGERPTIERVRNELGRGSPNTVNRLLDGWWTSLSARHAVKEASKLPPQFQSACERLYEKVVSVSKAQAEQALAVRQAQIDASERQLASREAELEAREAILSGPMDILRVDLSKSGQQLVDLSTRNGVLSKENEQLRERELAQEKMVGEAKAALSDLQASSKAELLRVRAQWEAQENRWLRQIDALREDLKLVRSDRAEERRATARQVSSLESLVAKLTKDLAASKKEANTAARPRNRKTTPVRAALGATRFNA